MRRPPRPLCLLVAALVLLGAGPRATAEDDRELEPIPRIVVFADPAEGGRDMQTQREVEFETQRSFASLGNVVRGRELLVRRFGILSVSRLVDLLQKNKAQSQVWNSALTVGALRDTEGPALELKAALRPLVRIVATSPNPHERAFAAIALGCFHWPESEVPELYRERADWYAAVPGPERRTVRGARALQDARKELVRLSNDKVAFTRVAALLALAKMGGPDVRQAYLAHKLDPFANPAPHRADLLARALLVAGDVKPYLNGLREEETPIRASAALAISVALLQEKRAPWTTDSSTVLKVLKGGTIKAHLADGAEAVFARGVCALQNQANDEWREIWRLATQHTTERHVAEAAAQILRFCELPWLRKAIVTWAVQPLVDLKPSVLAMVLLRAGEQGSPEALEALVKWLESRSKRPTPTARWDPRWYAAVGLLRALHAGRIRPQSDRARVVEALRKAASQILDRKAPFRAALTKLLDGHGDRIAKADESALYRLPLPALRRIESAFVCPHGLMTRDAIDACVRRVNANVQDLFGLNGIIPWKPSEPQTKQMPERFLKRYLDSYPYFSRLEFRERRGARPHPRLGADKQGIDR